MIRRIISPLTLSLLCPLLVLACDPEDIADADRLDDLDEVVDDADAAAVASPTPGPNPMALSGQCNGINCAQKSAEEWVSEVEADQPRNWWRFNSEMVDDFGSHPFDGDLLNGAVIAVDMPFGSAVKLGTTPWSCFHIGDTETLQKPWTVEAIFAADGTGVTGNPSTSVLVGPVSGSVAPGTLKAETWDNSGKMGYTTPWDTTFTSPAAATPTTFKHVVFVGTVDGMKLYVNGALVGQNPATMDLALGGIGGVSCEVGWAPGGVFGGLIDEMVVYEGDLGAGRIAAHFAAAKSALDSYYDCGNGVVEGAEACDDGNTDNTDRCSNTCQVQACPTGAPVRAMWVWNDYTNIANDATETKDLLDFSRSKAVNRLFFDVYDLEAGGFMTATPEGKATLATFIASADARCLEVELLIGPKKDGNIFPASMTGWMDSGGNVDVAVAVVAQAVTFSQNLQGPKPVGIHLDLEPSHASDWDKNATQTKKQEIYGRLIDRLYTIADAFAPNDPEFRLNADAPVSLNEWITHGNGPNQNAYKYLLDRLDVTFMDYIDFAGVPGPGDGLIPYVSDELAYARDHVPGRKVIVGVETLPPNGDLAPENTFHEEGAVAMNAALSSVSGSYANNAAFKGVAIHCYETYPSLME